MEARSLHNLIFKCTAFSRVIEFLFVYFPQPMVLQRIFVPVLVEKIEPKRFREYYYQTSSSNSKYSFERLEKDIVTKSL
jgi:hypothetical protein